MVQKICPICDKVMDSAHYCRNCRSWVKHPYVRDVGYYLNEPHPLPEARTSLEDGASPDGVWKPVGDSRPRYGSSGAAVLFVTAAVICVMVLFSGQFLYLLQSVTGPPVEYDIDLGEYTGEEDEIGHMVDEDAVAVRGEPCNTRGHFAVQGRMMEQPVLDLLKREGYQVGRHDTYSYNEAYDNGETWYTTWTFIEIEGDSYQYVELDFDTGTGELHEISFSLKDPEKLAAVTCGILEALAKQGGIDADADFMERVAGELAESIRKEEGFALLEGAVLIEGIAYKNNYTVYISHNMDGDF